MSPIAGFTRFRKHQVGVQSVIGTAVAATRVVPYRGAIEINPNREDPDVDVGSLDPILSPVDSAKEVTATWEGPLAYDDATLLWALTLKGGETASGGTAKTWDFDAASLTADVFEYITDEWGDDTSASDGIEGYGGVIDQLELSFDEELGVWQVNADLIYAGATMATDRTAGLTIDSTPAWVYGADTEVYLDTAAGSIGSTRLVDALHGLSLTINNNLDQKRFANGSNARFALAGFGRGPREIELELTLAKTTATMAEAATLDDATVANRYIQIKTLGSIITGATPYSQTINLPMRLISRSDEEIGGNSTIVLTYRGFYDSTLTYAIRATVVNTMATLAAAP